MAGVAPTAPVASAAASQATPHPNSTSSSTTKKPRLPPGARILTRKLDTSRPHHRSKTSSGSGATITRADQHLAPKRRIIIHRGTSLVAVLKRVQKLLDRSPGGALSMGLGDIGGKAGKPKAGNGSYGSGKKGGSAAAAADGDEVQVGDDKFPVVVIGAGALNIEKALKTAAVFQRRGDCVVRIYTNTVSGVDTYEIDGAEEGDEKEDGADSDFDMSGAGGLERGRTTVVKQRSRKASTLEVAIRLKT